MGRRKRLGTRIVIYSLLILALLFFLFPVFWTFVTSFKTQKEFFTYPPVFVPEQIDFHNYVGAMIPPPDGRNGFKSLTDSLIISLGTTALSIVLGAPAAYSLARWKTGGNDLSFWILSTRMFPPVAAVLPMFFIFQKLKLIDTYFALILANTMFVMAFVIWMLKGYFEDLPAELEEAALIDGCSSTRAFTLIALPLVAPGLVATTLFAFIFTWNEFLFALLLTRRAVRTLTVMIPSLVGGHEILWGEIAAAGIIAIIPGILLALLLQRYLVRGLTLGAVKG
jgi:multiple sugar transport system permease protein